MKEAMWDVEADGHQNPFKKAIKPKKTHRKCNGILERLPIDVGYSVPHSCCNRTVPIE